ncbi:MAG: response regulator, partial [Deltaproteobacteria bacterium]|nr:response regulator [Deltaproteobacteria bacterium]
MSPRILIVDDEENLCFTLERFLLAEGYQVATAGDYDGALAALDQTDFDLIFADIVLKGKTGMDLLGKIKAGKFHGQVVMITGVPTIDTASKAVRLGAFDYIPKPVTQEALLRVTRAAWRHKALVDEKDRYQSNLEAIFKSVKDAIITVDKALVVLEVNDA